MGRHLGWALPSRRSPRFGGRCPVMTILAVAAGFAADLAFGDPRWLPHPVVAMG
uniref:hypothetical protein n=1 Tax=Collinsella aerofaciens TaxID=74426 RepID=UPI003FF04505